MIRKRPAASGRRLSGIRGAILGFLSRGDLTFINPPSDQGAERERTP